MGCFSYNRLSKTFRLSIASSVDSDQSNPSVSLSSFWGKNLTRTSAGMLSTWLFSKVLAIENKSVSLRNECLTKIAGDSCQLIFKKRKERLVLSSLTIAQTRRVISKYWVAFSALVVDIRLLTAPQNRSKQSKRPITRKTFPAKLD